MKRFNVDSYVIGAIGAFILFLLLIVGLFALQTVVVYFLWNWVVVMFGVAEIGWVTAMGVSLIISVIRTIFSKGG